MSLPASLQKVGIRPDIIPISKRVLLVAIALIAKPSPAWGDPPAGVWRAVIHDGFNKQTPINTNLWGAGPTAGRKKTSASKNNVIRAETADGIYDTRGGPWEPVDGQYGYTYKDFTVFAHLLHAYQGNAFQVPPKGGLRVVEVYDVFTGKSLPYTTSDGSIKVTKLYRQSSPADTIIAMVYDQPVANLWKD